MSDLCAKDWLLKDPYGLGGNNPLVRFYYGARLYRHDESVNLFSGLVSSDEEAFFNDDGKLPLGSCVQKMMWTNSIFWRHKAITFAIKQYNKALTLRNKQIKNAYYWS